MYFLILYYFHIFPQSLIQACYKKEQLDLERKRTQNYSRIKINYKYTVKIHYKLKVFNCIKITKKYINRPMWEPWIDFKL